MIPDRLRRWLIFFLAVLFFILSQFYRASIAVIAPNLIADLNLDTRALSLVSASFFYAFAVVQIPISFYLDSIGPRISMTLLAVVAVAGALTFAWGQSPAMLIAGRMLLGAGMACNFMGALKLITLWFGPLRFATLAALLTSLSTIGSLTAATPLVLLVATLGWRTTFTLFGGLNFLLALVFFAVVRDRPRNAAGRIPPPAASGLAEILKRFQVLFREKDYWIISLGTFCRYGIYASVQALWAGPYLLNVIGTSPVAAGNLLFLMSIGLIVGSPACGYASDALVRSRKKLILMSFFGMILVLIILACLPGKTHMVWLSVLFFSFGFFSSAGQIVYTHIKERMPLEIAGTALTGINFFSFVGVSFFLHGLGSLMQSRYPEAYLGPAAFKGAFLLCSACLAIAAILYFFTRETLGVEPGNGGKSG